MVRHEFDYEYSDELLRLAMKRSFAEQLSWRAIAIMVVLFLVGLVICGSGDWGYVCGLVHGGLILVVLLFALMRASAAETAQRFARKLPTRAAHCVFTEEAMTSENALATSVLKRPIVQTVVRGPDVWLFFLARGQFMALPADKLTGEVGAFIESRVTAAGGRMR